LATKVTLKLSVDFSGNKISVESYLLPKKSFENKHGKIHPWKMDTHRHNTGIRTQQGYKQIGTGTQRDGDIR
jgi:hypothetical protein